MIGHLFHVIIFEPIYNGLVFFITLLPWADLGIDIIFFTLIVRLILLPLSLKSVRTQQKTKLIEPELKRLREEHKDDKQMQMLKTMELYREHNVRPFAGILIMLVQFPILIGLYYAFLKTGLPTIDHTLLYSFTPVPHDINPLFLGLVDLTQKSFVLALIAAVVQFIQTKLAMPTLPPKATPAVGEELSSEAMKQEFSRTIALQMRFIFPVIIFFIAYNLSGAIAIYLATGGIFYIAQELYVRRSLKSKYPDPEDLVIATTEDSE